MTVPPDLSARLAAALAAAREAGDLTLTYFRSPSLQVERKGDDSPVTEADKRSEQLIRQRLAAAFPGDGFLGEEFPETYGTSGFRWVTDPIDGTRSFSRGIPTYAVLIGLEHEGQIVAGVAHHPALGETLHAIRGHGATWRTPDGQDRPARVSSHPNLHRAIIELAPPQTLSRYTSLDLYPHLAAASERLRGWNDAYTMTMLATGRIEAAVSAGFKLWDVAPYLAIIPEAGGRITDWSGATPAPGPLCLATNGHVHAEALALLAPFTKAPPAKAHNPRAH